MRTLIAVVIVLLTFEGVSMLAPHIVGKQVHQKYLCYQRECLQDSTNKGKVITWKANGKGARGDLYHGQDVRIAIFGTSTSIDVLLGQDESYAQQFKQKLGVDRVHVDNFARDGSLAADAEVLLKDIADKKQKYDVVILMEHIDKKEEDAQIAAFHYWSQWVVDGPLKFPSLLRKRIKEQVKTEPRLNKIDRWVHDDLINKNKPAKPTRNQIREMRRDGRIKLIDIAVSVDFDKTRMIQNQTQHLIEAAAKISDKVYIVLQPIAYDPLQLPSVAEKWFTRIKVSGKDNYYQSNKSVAEWRRKENSIMAEVARSLKVEVVDLDGYMRQFLSERDDLFDDKWHFAPAGAEIAAQFVAERIAKDIFD